MSDLVPQVPQKLARKKRQSSPQTFTAPTAADPQSALDSQITAVEDSKKLLGLNVAQSLNEASQRGFVTGLQQGLQEGAATEAAFFSSCITAAGTSLL